MIMLGIDCLKLKMRFFEITFPKSIVYREMVLDKNDKGISLSFLSNTRKVKL